MTAVTPFSLHNCFCPPTASEPRPLPAHLLKHNTELFHGESLSPITASNIIHSFGGTIHLSQYSCCCSCCRLRLQPYTLAITKFATKQNPPLTANNIKWRFRRGGLPPEKRRGEILNREDNLKPHASDIHLTFSSPAAKFQGGVV